MDKMERLARTQLKSGTISEARGFTAEFVNIRPAGLGRLAARAPKQIAPPAAATPVVNQTGSSQNGEPSDFTMPAVVRKIPTPITSATTSAVAVVSPNCRESLGSWWGSPCCSNARP